MNKSTGSNFMKRKASDDGKIITNKTEAKKFRVEKKKPLPKKARRKFKKPDDPHQNDSLYKGSTTVHELKKLFKFEKVIGEGGYGKVYGARRVIDNLPVAIKFAQKNSVPLTKVGNCNIPSEAYYMKQASGHLNIIALYEYYQTADHFVFVLERPVHCDDMFNLLQDGNPVSEKTAKYIFKQLLSAVQHCHDRGVLHNDIKDENILYDFDTGLVKLIDFGLAEKVTSQPKNNFKGTRLYGPPEWFTEGVYNRLDATVWTLGTFLYVLLCGGFAFANVGEITQNKNIPFIGGISEEARDCVYWMLSKNPVCRASLEMVLAHPWLES